jgi:O-antigen polymerase
LCLALYTLVVSHVNILHLPGAGMLLPQVVLGWMTAGLLMLAAAFSAGLRQAWRPTPFMTCCAAGVVLLSLPLCYAPSTWRYLAELRVAGLWGGLLLMVAARALFDTPSRRRAVAVLLLAGCVLEAGVAMARLLVPDLVPDGLPSLLRGRVAGVFVQVNVMASFLSTGVMLCGYLLSTARGRTASLLLPVVTAVTGFCLPLTQSTQAWLGLGLAGLLVLVTRRTVPARNAVMLRWLGVLVVAVLAGVLYWHGQHGAMLPHDGGRLGRLQMWQNCLWLIAQHPWTGWGYGHFEMAYVQAWMTTGNVPQIDHSLVLHPHNELLYWLTEGGAVAGAGLALIVAGGIRLFRDSLRQAMAPGADNPGTAPAAEAVGLVCCTLPVLIHSQLEWPFYLSAWHWLMVVLLLSLADGAVRERERQPATPPHSSCVATTRGGWLTGVARLLLATAGGLILWWMSTGLWLGQQLVAAALPGGLSTPQLQAVERARTVNPWVLKEEVWRLEAVAQANRAYQTGDLSLLAPVIAFEEQYLRRHPDAGITAHLMKHLRLTGQTEKARALTARAQAMFPWDARFTDVPPLPQTPFLNTGDVTAPDTTINPDTGIQDLTEETP